MINLHYLMDHILHQRFNIIFKYIISKHRSVTDNSPIRINVNKILNRIKSKIKKWCSLELLMPELMKLLGSTKNKITKR